MQAFLWIKWMKHSKSGSSHEMACIVCKKDKLRNEYPPENISDDCDHPCLVCLRCTVNHVDAHQRCPYPKCEQNVPKTSKQLNIWKAILNQQFKEYASEYTPPAPIDGNKSFVNITGLTGESIIIPFSPSQTINQLKQEIQLKMKQSTDRQKLLYEENEMKATKDGRYATLADYGVKPNSTICLVIRLYSIPDIFDDVIFDLYWGYPKGQKDYLDACCLQFSRTSHRGVIDYRRRKNRTASIKHSGDVMDDHVQRGHHTIKVSLKKIPSDITHLFFTLSAFYSPTIAKYPNPSLRFFDAKNPEKDLCKTTFNHAIHSRTVIMCSVSRNADGQWQIFESGQMSDGSAQNFGPIIQTIQRLIRQGI